MGVIMLSLKVVLFCSVAVVTFLPQEANAGWGSFRVSVPRISTPRIRIPRISTPRISIPRIIIPRISLPRISTPRISIPGISLPGISLPRIRLPAVRIPRVRLPGIRFPPIPLPVIPLPPISLPGTDPICLNINLKKLLPIGRISCDDPPRQTPISPTTTPRVSKTTPRLSTTTPRLSTTTPRLSTTSSTPVFDSCSLIISRPEWGAPSITESETLRLPMQIIVMYLRGDNCSTKQECTEKAKHLYKENENYNFMIGGDGTVFEGRGWHKFSDHYFSYGRVEYGVAFLGKSFTEKMSISFLYLIDCGISGGMLPSEITDKNIISRP